MGMTIFKTVILGRYIVRYMFGNHVLRLHWQVTVKLNSDHISDDFIPPQIKNIAYSYPLNLLKFFRVCKKNNE